MTDTVVIGDDVISRQGDDFVNVVVIFWQRRRIEYDKIMNGHGRPQGPATISVFLT
jgi:hypothetical protein